MAEEVFEKKMNLSELLAEDIDAMIWAFPMDQFKPVQVAKWALQHMYIVIDRDINAQSSLTLRITDHCKRLAENGKLKIIRRLKKQRAVYVFDKRVR